MRVIKRDPYLIKPYYVVGKSLIMENEKRQIKEGIKIISMGLLLQPENKELLELYEKYHDRTRNPEYESLYDEVVQDIESGSTTMSFNGLFRQFEEDSTFQQLIYPSIPKAQREALPKTLLQLLKSKIYKHALIEIGIPKALKNAEDVLNRVKKNGEKDGDTMDKDTEAILRPQIFREAFARQIIPTVKHIHSMYRLQTSSTPAKISGEDVDSQNMGRIITQSSVHEMMENGFQLFNAVMGAEWSDLLLDDLDRYFEDNEEKNGEKQRFLYICGTPEELVVNYPALGELLGRFRKLPGLVNAHLNLSPSEAYAESTGDSIGIYRHKSNDTIPEWLIRSRSLDDDSSLLIAHYWVTPCESVQLKVSDDESDTLIEGDSMVMFNPGENDAFQYTCKETPQMEDFNDSFVIVTWISKVPVLPQHQLQKE